MKNTISVQLMVFRFPFSIFSLLTHLLFTLPLSQLRTASASSSYSMLRTALASRTTPRLVRFSSVRFSPDFDQPQQKPPTLRDFRYPLFHTFLMASSAFMALNALWYALEYEEVEKQLVAESASLESALQLALDDAANDLTKRRSWASRLWFWRQ